MHAGSGLISHESFGRFRLSGCFSKTCRDLFTEVWEPSSLTWPRAGSMRNGTVFARPTSAHRTGGTGSSCWPTPQAHDGRRLGSDEGSTQGRNLKRESEKWATPAVHTAPDASPNSSRESDLREQVKLWATPKENDGGTYSGVQDQEHPETTSGLAQQTRLWNTPSARDWKDGDPSQNVATNSLLGRQAPRNGIGGQKSSTDGPTSPQLWPSPRSNKWGPPDSHGKIPVQWQTPRVGPHGPAGEGLRHQGQPKGKRLNPFFVEWLMGLPRGWTAFALLGMPSSQLKPPSHGKCLKNDSNDMAASLGDNGCQ